MMALAGDPVLYDALKGVVPLVEVEGWRIRGRPWLFTPKYVLCHHTASIATPNSDITYINMGRSDAPGPISQLYISREPKVYLLAAGGANHAGSGRWPDGTTGNRYGWGIEAANSGGLVVDQKNLDFWVARAESVGAKLSIAPVGDGRFQLHEPWSKAMIDVYADTVNALLKAFGWEHDRVVTHSAYAPSRKIDPAGRTAFNPHDTSWQLDAWRYYCALRDLGGLPAAPPSPPVEANPPAPAVPSPPRPVVKSAYYRGDGTYPVFYVEHITAERAKELIAVDPEWASKIRVVAPSVTKPFEDLV